MCSFWSVLFSVRLLLFGTCRALPILNGHLTTEATTITTDKDFYTFLIGAGSLLIIGGILGACVCCRRRWRGFEEFENESGVIDAARSEYPIFRAISSPSNHGNSTQSLNQYAENVQPVQRNNIGQNNFDNNNGPISPADMENIENNNAVDYIPSRNEVGVIEEAIFSVDYILMAAAAAPTQPTLCSHAKNNELELPHRALNVEPPDCVIAVPTPVKSIEPIKSPTINLNPFKLVNLDEMHIYVEDDDVDDDDDNDHDDDDDIDVKDANDIHQIDEKSHTINTNNELNNLYSIEKNYIDDFTYENKEKSINVEVSCRSSIYNSNESVASDKKQSSVEENSVEEALRALDFAISGEDSLPIDEMENELSDEAININTTTSTKNVQEILQQFLINNGATNLLSIDQSELPKNRLSMQNEVLFNNVKFEAEQLVNNIIDECQLILDRRLEKYKLSSQTAYENNISLQTTAKNINSEINNCDSSDNQDKYTKQHSNEIIKNQEEILFFHREDNLNCTIIDRAFSPNASNVTNESYIPAGDVNSIENNKKSVSKVDETLTIEKSFLNDSFLTTSTPLCKPNWITSETPENKKHGRNLFESSDYSLSSSIVEGIAIINDSAHNITEQHLDITKKTDVNASSDLDEEFSNNIKVENVAKTQICCSNILNSERKLENVTFDTNETVNVTNILVDGVIENATFIKSNQTLCKEDNVAECRETHAEYPIIKIDHDEMMSADLSTVTPVNTPIELNYSLVSWDKFISNSMSQTATIVPQLLDANEPCTSAQAECSGWFLHPQQIQHIPSVNDTYQLNDNDEDNDDDDDNDDNDDNDDDEEDRENLNQTFDALRKQLAESLPHAQGIGGPLDFNDNDNDDDDEEELDRDQSGTKNDEIFHTEMVINYKRPLSPIIEESEDETCKTFVMNDMKLLDSTSTGCIETGEAIMGVTKTLMASNDTLFNFEDTLGERDDLFSPRANSQQDFMSPVLKSDSKIQATTVLNSTTTTALDVESAVAKSFPTIEFSTSSDFVAVNELLSPDQPKTFSDETITVDHGSSDLSGTVDGTGTTTNTMEEKTCISVHIHDDERISEISEPDWNSTSYNAFDVNTFADIVTLAENQGMENGKTTATGSSDVPTIIDSNLNKKHRDLNKFLDEDEEENSDDCVIKQSSSNEYPDQKHDSDDKNSFNKSTVEITTSFLNSEITFSSSQQRYDKTNVKKSSDNQKENNDPNVKTMDACDLIDSTKLENSLEAVIRDQFYISNFGSKLKNTEFHISEKSVDLHKHLPIIGNCFVSALDVIDEQQQQCVMLSDDRISRLSGEEDPWASPITDTRCNGPSGGVAACNIINTSFVTATNEWDSDIDDSNSSEEFMYVKGTPDHTSSVNQPNKNIRNEPSALTPDNDMDTVWNSHQDKIPVSSTKEAKDEFVETNSDECNSDLDGEWVPSSWDSMAQPSRSAMKSPDKSKNITKQRRNVAFKKQNYHSIYEYPKESISLSPSYSEPQIWDKNIPNLRMNTETSSSSINLNNLDGFIISSSARPFHGSQFNAQCHTWPTDTDFSWSQVENEEHVEKYPTYSDLQIKWSKSVEIILEQNSCNKVDGESARPDSGVGESAELLSESFSLGDLCHTKSSLTLPLKVVPIEITSKCDSLVGNAMQADTEDLVVGDDVFSGCDTKHNLPSTTPSFTGSMDSLSSSSDSEHQVSLTTLGKSNPIYENDILNEQNLQSTSTTTMALINSEQMKSTTEEAASIKNNSNCINATKHDRSSTKQNDSTDEDSGIESIMRIAKENV